MTIRTTTPRFRGRGSVSPLLLLALLLLAATLVVGCGSKSESQSQQGTQSDKYVGTWIQAVSGSGNANPPIVIRKSGSDYVLTGPDGATDQGYMLHTDPTAAGEMTIYAMTLNETKATEEGGHLTFGSAENTVEITVSGDAMTLVVSSVDGVFTFSRVTS